MLTLKLVISVEVAGVLEGYVVVSESEEGELVFLASLMDVCCPLLIFILNSLCQDYQTKRLYSSICSDVGTAWKGAYELNIT